MRELTASEAGRHFSALLDAAERGETIVVTRSGQRIALIGPAPRANGAALRAVFDRWRGNAAVDDAFAANVTAGRSAVAADLDVDPWRG
jgi:prevent-host-death family protein